MAHHTKFVVKDHFVAECKSEKCIKYTIQRYICFCNPSSYLIPVINSLAVSMSNKVTLLKGYIKPQSYVGYGKKEDRGKR